MSNVSEHISRVEYECKHCHKLPASWSASGGPDVYGQFFLDFEEIREEWGKPIIINSGYRCPEYNKKVGGEELSAHLWGLALDISPERPADPRALYRVILDIQPEFRLGYYAKKGFIHMDCAYLIDPIVVKEWHPGARWNG